ncbi:MAG: nuclear transport factor 2 family protein [Nitrospinota bacterium]|nr:nuclear transport factor 2 family protein [Nitrospinota bacterium]MDH5757654.1 nuclear transport factor 2 family protein [Nitrospinota bacterium]
MSYRAIYGAAQYFLVLSIITFSLPGLAESAEAAKGFHSIRVSPEMKEKVDHETMKRVSQFFHDAEEAISKGDIDALMDLYSDSYKNGDHDKAAAKAIWQRIFSVFENMSTMHNMNLVNYSQDGGLIVIGCSGILLGMKKGEGDRVPVDTWTNEEHILTLEKGKWKLVGSAGQKRKRLWFDKPMHPLF